MNEVLRSILSDGHVTTADGTTRPLASAISPEEGNFLQQVIRNARPQVSLEVGCAYGISSLYICAALREVNAAKHIILDPYQHSVWEGLGLANLRRAGYLDLIDFHEIPSYQYLSRLAEEHVTIDFAFIDGNHIFDYVFVDLFLIDKLLRPGGIVILDDLSWPSVRSVCRYVLSNLRYKCIGPQSKDLPRRAAWRKLVSRARQGGIRALVRAPLRRIFLPDSRLNLPEYLNYAAFQKLADGYWSQDERPISSLVTLINVRLN